MSRNGGAALAGIVLAADVFALDCAFCFFARQRLIFEQRTGEQVKLVDIVGEDLTRNLFAFFDKAADFCVDQLGGFFRHILRA